MLANNEVGTLEPGKLADVIAVRGNPLTDIAAKLTADKPQDPRVSSLQAALETRAFNVLAMLLGVKVVIAESFERIHRSNLVGMGILPLQFKTGQSVSSLGLTGYE